MGKIRLLWQLFSRYLANLSTYVFSDRISHSDRRIVFFNLKDLRVGANYAFLFYAFHHAGYHIYLKHDFRFIANSKGHLKQIFELKNLCLIFFNWPVKADILICDRFTSSQSCKALKKINIDCNFIDALSKNKNKILPYHLSPHLYYNNDFRTASQLRESQKTSMVLFSGNIHSNLYNDSIIQDLYNKLTRIEIIETIEDSSLNDKIIKVESKNPTSDISLSDKIVLHKWEWSPKNHANLHIRINNDAWLQKLSETNFFLCTPGIRMPICFNSIEAMSVGTIPILEYPEYFNPPLTHLENAVIFNGKKDLIEKIHVVFDLSEDIIAGMRQNVISYYEAHLHPTASVELIENIKERESTVYVFAEQASISDYWYNKSK